MIVLGIDPGAKNTGMVLVEFDRGKPPALLWADTIRRIRYTSALPVPDTYLDAIHAAAATHSADVVAVESVTAPSPHMERAFYQSAPLLATSFVAGWCLGKLAGHAPAVMQIPPKGNGGAPLGTYPDALVSKRERSHPGWRFTPGGDGATLRHVRSAFDVATVAHRIATATRKVNRPA